MEIHEPLESNEYLSKIIERYSFIESIILSDIDGSLIAVGFKDGFEKIEENEKDIRSILSYNFEISLDQISKTYKWKTNSITLFFDKHVIYQKKLNEIVICHIICNENEYFHEITKNVADKLGKKFESILNKLIEIRNENKQ